MGCGCHESSSGDLVGGVSTGRCVCDVVRAIKDIQDAATDVECGPCPTNCFLEPLGGLVSPARTQADTRVFMLLTKDGSPFKAFYRDRDVPDCDCFSVFFRVEEVFDCCATLRVLEPLDFQRHEVQLLTECGTKLNLKKLCSVRNYRLTSSCLTVDLSCFCGVQCVADVFLDVCQ